MSFKREMRGASLIIGSIIGAGILGIPYAAKELGLIPSLLVMLIIGVVLYFTSIILLKFSAKYQGSPIASLAKNTLGRPGGYLMMAGAMIYIYGALLAYMSAGGNTISSLSPISEVPAALIFWLVCSYIIFKGLEASIKTEFILVMGIIGLFILVTLTSLPHSEVNNALYTNFNGIQTFVGVSLFAFVGHAMVPDVYLDLNDYDEAKRSVKIAFVLIYFLYAILTIAFILVFGREIPQIAPKAFKQLYGNIGKIIGNLLPLITITTSFIGFGLAQKDNYDDYVGLNRELAWGITTIPPLFLYLYGIREFVGVLQIAGNVGAVIMTLIVPIAMYAVWKYNI
ncbi:MAG: Tryptophan/tyrosine permease family [Candidatus Methanohalarchaeum thermophilum]|uniref:Tryptophan/tyrosine permease family n=1 Tax=Methanohalarchaeum thermophilum TaxID=1903181 RepID=A0A1Q6DVS4_METT1|nr:MAG: Tryptophan/tyrosine permease family [Candidatus Methanohalarchaeum thermophilum]